MSSKELKSREQIDKKYKWNIEAMISDESSIDEDLSKIKNRLKNMQPILWDILLTVQKCFMKPLLIRMISGADLRKSMYMHI